MDAVLIKFRGRGARSLGIYNRRRVAGQSAWSLHAVGRAGDISGPKHVLDEIAMRMIDAQRHNRLPELQEVIYNGSRYTSLGKRPYRGADDHRTHIHFSLTIAGADTRLRADLDRQRITRALFPSPIRRLANLLLA